VLEAENSTGLQLLGESPSPSPEAPILVQIDIRAL
jgi:hypothetical protein